MFSMSPEDRLRSVIREQDRLRAQIALERLASAASARHTIEPSEARGAGNSRSRQLAMTVRQRIDALAGRRAAARYGADR